MAPGIRVFYFFNCNRRIWRLILKTWGLWGKCKSLKVFSGYPHYNATTPCSFFCFFQFSHFFAKKDFALQHDLLLDSFRMSSRPTSATGTAPTPSHHPPMLSARVEDFLLCCWTVGGGVLVIYIVWQWTANDNQDFENEQTSPKMDGSLAYTHWINTD